MLSKRNPNNFISITSVKYCFTAYLLIKYLFSLALLFKIFIFEA